MSCLCVNGGANCSAPPNQTLWRVLHGSTCPQLFSPLPVRSGILVCTTSALSCFLRPLNYAKPFLRFHFDNDRLVQFRLTRRAAKSPHVGSNHQMCDHSTPAATHRAAVDNRESHSFSNSFPSAPTSVAVPSSASSASSVAASRVPVARA